VRLHTEEWVRLCQQASVEQDPARLVKLIQRINELLEEKRNDWQEIPVPITVPNVGSVRLTWSAETRSREDCFKVSVTARNTNVRLSGQRI